MTNIEQLFPSTDEGRPSFEANVRALMPGLLAYFARRVSPVEDAADCLSETLAVLWRRKESLPTEREEIRAWSFGVAKRVLANHRRTQIRQTLLGAKLREYISVHRRDAPVDLDLERALQTLKPEDRELVLLVAWDGFSVAEAGQHLDIKPDAARTRYSRARKQLRELLSDAS